MRREATGSWACPDDFGRDVVTLARGNARAAKAIGRRRVAKPQGVFYDGLVREPEEADETVTYDDPSVRFGASRLIGWWQPTTANCTLSSGSVTAIRDLGDNAVHLTEAFAFPPRHTLETDSELELEVLVAEGTVPLAANSNLATVVPRALPVSWWITSKVPPSQTLASYGQFHDVAGYVSTLRVDMAGVAARVSQVLSLSTLRVPVTLGSWHVYGLEWIGNVYRLTLDGTELSRIDAPPPTRVTGFSPIGTGITGWRVAEIVAVVGDVTAEEAVDQARYMMQYAGLE